MKIGFSNLLNPKTPRAETPPSSERESGVYAQEQRAEQLPTIETSHEQEVSRENLDAKRTYMRAMALDETFRSFFKGSPEERVRQQQKLDSLQDGEELMRESIGDVGVNDITRRIFESGETRTSAFVKTKLGEAALRYDPATNAVIKSWHRFDADTQEMERVEAVDVSGNKTFDEYLEEARVYFADVKDPTKREQLAQAEAQADLQYAQNIVYAIKTRTEYQPTLRAEIAQRYGIAPENVPLTEGEFMPREGIDINTSAIREYSFSRVDRLLGFNVVPLTAIRAEKNDAGEVIDIASAQEAVIAKGGKEAPLRVFSPLLYQEMKQQGKNHPGAKSFMRIATLDYLLKTLDRHPKNIFFDPTTNEFSAIDNGLSQALGRQTTKTGPDGKTVVENTETNALRSIPLEMVQEQPDWELDEEALSQLTQFYDAAVQYLEREKTISSLQAEGKHIHALIEDTLLPLPQGSEAIKYLTELYKLQFGNEKIAKEESLALLKRIKQVIDNRRPPQLARGSNPGELESLSIPYGLDKSPVSVRSQQAA